MRILKSFVTIFVTSSISFAFTSWLAAGSAYAGVECAAAGAKSGEIDTAAIDACLKADGVRLEVHGISKEHSTAVVTYRAPDFFTFQNFSLITRDRVLRELIFTLGRHDVVIVKGELGALKSPQKHIRASEIVVEKKSTAHDGMPPYQYEAKLPDELKNKNTFRAVVHALFEGGKILVVEYKDAVVPVFVEPKFEHLTKSLYRNDVVEISYEIQETPGRPVHLLLIDQDKTGAALTPLKVLESLVSKHGQPFEFTGELTMFPKSPMVMFNVFALKEDLGDGLRRYYTLLNFDPELFKTIRTKLQAIWDSETTGRVNDRSKWVNTRLRVRARGHLNIVDPNQANPQILLDSADAIELMP